MKMNLSNLDVSEKGGAYIRVGATDAEYLEKEFYPIFNKYDFVHLPLYTMYLKLMIDGATSKPFSATSVKHYSEDLHELLRMIP